MNDRMEELRSPLEKYRERIEAQRKGPCVPRGGES